MNSESSQRSEIEEQLSAYFDDELDRNARAQIEAVIDVDGGLAAQFSDFSFIRKMVVGDLEHQAERVPEARFEQIWDRFEASVERESRLQEAAEAPPPFWHRLLEWTRPLRMPIAAVGATGVLLLVVVRSVGSPDEVDQVDEIAANTPEAPTSDQPPPTPEVEPAPELSVLPTPQIAVAPDLPAPSELETNVFPHPEPGEAEIRHIEFGGRSGTISQLQGTRGTTTVIWVTEDDPVDSERSL